MKNKIIVAVLALTIFGIAPMSFAATYGKSAGASYMVVEGTIVSIDKAKKLFAIKDRDDRKVYGLLAWVVDISSLNQGDNVKVTVPLPGGLVSKITR